MRLLLDTHVVLWWLTGEERLDAALKEIIDHDPDVFVSSASIWETAIKIAQGRLAGAPDLPERILSAGLRVLDVTARHGIAAARLPLIHRDPFDRMLVAQAVAEDLTLATRDRLIQRYEVQLMVV